MVNVANAHKSQDETELEQILSVNRRAIRHASPLAVLGATRALVKIQLPAQYAPWFARRDLPILALGEKSDLLCFPALTWLDASRTKL